MARNQRKSHISAKERLRRVLCGMDCGAVAIDPRPITLPGMADRRPPIARFQMHLVDHDVYLSAPGYYSSQPGGQRVLSQLRKSIKRARQRQYGCVSVPNEMLCGLEDGDERTMRQFSKLIEKQALLSRKRRNGREKLPEPVRYKRHALHHPRLATA